VCFAGIEAAPLMHKAEAGKEACGEYAICSIPSMSCFRYRK